MLLEYPVEWKDYELIDSGDFEKLERFGNFCTIRPEPKALWKKSLSEKEWNSLAHTKFTQGAGFGKSGKEDSGTWNQLKKMPDRWTIDYDKRFGKGSENRLGFTLRMGLTSFKHVGVFPEQAPNWDYIFGEVKRLKNGGIEQPKVLNLFAYTGAASLAARAAGAQVTHLDSVKQVVTWARDNMELSGLTDIRWVIEDALKFVKREVKRGNKYNGLILDPPAYGHGPDGEKWKLDELLFELLTGCRNILFDTNSFLVLNLYSNGYSAVLAETAVRCAFGLLNEGRCDLKYGELALKDRFGKALPLSVFVRLSR
jgi:23S rRNA (cytosine1962-C5)-methyltransferase